MSAECSDHEAIKIACNIIRSALTIADLPRADRAEALESLEVLECHLALCRERMTDE
jgi:hypothetical protein